MLIYLRLCNRIVLFRVSLDLCRFRSFRCIYECQAWTACLDFLCRFLKDRAQLHIWQGPVDISTATSPAEHYQISQSTQLDAQTEWKQSKLPEHNSVACAFHINWKKVKVELSECALHLPNQTNTSISYSVWVLSCACFCVRNETIRLVGRLCLSNCMPRHLVCWCHGLWFQDNTPS